MKHLPHLIVLFALAPLAAQAALPAGPADEIRERLRPFGQVCRTGEACPAPSAEPAAAAESLQWTVVGIGDDQGEPTTEQGVQSPWAPSDIHWPETAASMVLVPGTSSSMRFTYLNLAGGESSRYGDWQNHWITLAIGEREKEFRVREPSGGQDILLLGSGPSRFVTQALEANAGDTLTVRMHYHGAGQVEFQLPLQGAKKTLQSMGVISASGVDEIAEVDVATATPPVETPAADAAAGRSGKEIYDSFCFACHATGVAQAPLFGSLEQWQPRIDKGMDTLVATSLTGFNLMPPMGICMSCTEDEMRASIQYMIDTAR